MKKFFYLLITALFVNCSGLWAQSSSGKISGRVTDAQGKELPAITVQLQNAIDSVMVKMGASNKEGQFVFSNLGKGVYRVVTSSVAHESYYSEPIIITEAGEAKELGVLTLEPQAKSIGAVSVTSKRPMFEQKAGKILVNVDASQTNAGLNALELLEKTPGVTVDNDGNISVKGKQGVLVLIDGKPTNLSGADLAAILKGLQSSQLEQLEVMTNPPAKYDAAGNSGIINIKTKKGTIRGMNGNANFSYTQGIYARLNGGVNLNYRNNKWNVYGGINGGTFEGFNRMNIDRRLYGNDGQMLRSIDQVSRPKYTGDYENFKLGADYYFSPKDVIGVEMNAGLNINHETPVSNTNIRDNQGNIVSKLYTGSKNKRKSDRFTTNINYKHTFDSTGREITVDLDYQQYNMRNRSLMTTESLNPNGEKIGDDVLLRGDIPSVINVYSGKVDYVHPVSKTFKIEAGLKSSIVETDNQVRYFRAQGYDWTPDARTNHFVYKENINAAYLILNKTIKKFEINAGLRVENTVAKGNQITTDSVFKRNYTNLFPNLGVSYEASEKHQFSVSYSRRLMRPNYDALNPFIFFLDSLTYGQGNPYLKPQFSNNLELSHTFNRALTTTLNYSQTTDIITELLRQNTEKNETYQTRENFSKMKQFGVSIMLNKAITKWWNTNWFVNGFRNEYDGVYNNDPVNIKFNTVMASSTHTFTLGKGWSAELNGWFRSKGVEGLLVINNIGALNAGISKQMMKKKGNLKLGIRDIFLTQQFSGYARYSDVDVDIAGRRDSRQFNLSFTYRFGKTNIKPERRKKSSATDEANRINAN